MPKLNLTQLTVSEVQYIENAIGIELPSLAEGAAAVEHMTRLATVEIRTRTMDSFVITIH